MMCSRYDQFWFLWIITLLVVFICRRFGTPVDSILCVENVHVNVNSPTVHYCVLYGMTIAFVAQEPVSRA